MVIFVESNIFVSLSTFCTQPICQVSNHIDKIITLTTKEYTPHFLFDKVKSYICFSINEYFLFSLFKFCTQLVCQVLYDHIDKIITLTKKEYTPVFIIYFYKEKF